MSKDDDRIYYEYTKNGTQIKFWNTQFSCLILEKWYQINAPKKNWTQNRLFKDRGTKGRGDFLNLQYQLQPERACFFQESSNFEIQFLQRVRNVFCSNACL